jgi:hypothetical protein
MSGRHFDSTEDAQLREKIDEAKRHLPLPELMRQLGYDEKHIGKTAVCPFHRDQHPSFSVFQKNGAWFHRCFVGCSSGDEITFLVKHFGISRRDAIKRYLDMAGFPAHVPDKSREYPESHKYPKCPQSPKFSCASWVLLSSPQYPVSNGPGLEKELKGLAASNACTERNTARKRRWQLLRDLRAVEIRLGRELNTPELMLALYEWYRLSHLFLDPQKTPDFYLAAFLAGLRKVRVPTGEGDTIKTALASVSELSDSELPVIPGEADTPESWRRVLAVHREVSRRVGGGTYFLSSRDAAKAFHGLCHQTAYNINLILAQRGAIEIVRVGDARPNGKASQFRYLLSKGENGAEEDDVGLEI